MNSNILLALTCFFVLHGSATLLKSSGSGAAGRRITRSDFRFFRSLSLRIFPLRFEWIPEVQPKPEVAAALIRGLESAEEFRPPKSPIRLPDIDRKINLMSRMDKILIFQRDARELRRANPRP